MLPIASTSSEVPEELEDFHCKIVLVGDCKCGKTALIHQFVNEEFLQVSDKLMHINFAVVERNRVTSEDYYSIANGLMRCVTEFMYFEIMEI